jgi:hypothetical protein
MRIECQLVPEIARSIEEAVAAVCSEAGSSTLVRLLRVPQAVVGDTKRNQYAPIKVVMNRARTIMDCIHSGPPSNDKKAITMPATIASTTSTVTTIFAR